MIAVFKREFKSYFQSVTGWLFTAAVLAFFGLYYYVYNLMQGYPYIYDTLSAVTIIFLIAVPVLTMRSFAEERKNKTDQLLFTSPVSVGKLVLGKYLSMVAVFTIDVILFCGAVLVLCVFGTTPVGENLLSVFAFWLYGCVSIAVGMFLSSLTESQVIAAVLTFIVLFVSNMMQSITGLISQEGNWLTKILDCFDIYAPFEKFSGGCLDLNGVVYDLTVILLLNFLTLQSIQKRRFSISRKTLKTGVFSVSCIVVAIALTVAANLGVNVLPEEKTVIDCSDAKLYSITKDTKKAVQNLKEDVNVYVLAAKKQKDSQIDAVLKRYEDLSGHIKVSYVNPTKKPSFYKQYTDTSPTKNSLIVESEKRSRVIDYYDIYRYETSMDESYSYSNELTGFDAEGQLTSAIEYVTMDEKKLPVVYEITGHGEQSIGSEFQDVVKKANMTLSSVELLNEESVPEDAAAIIINAPQKDFNSADAGKVIDYLKAGGKAVIVGSYTGKELSNFDSILKEYQVSFTGGLVAENDPEHYYNMGGPLYMLPEVKESSYSGSLGGSYVYVPAATGITYPKDSKKVSYTSILDTTGKAVSKSDPDHMKDYEFEEGDVKGPFSVGLAVEKKVDDENTTKILVFGSPYLFSDEASQMTANNTEFFSGAISALVPEQQPAGSVIPEKKCTVENLTVNAFQAVFIGLLITIAVPLILIIFGIVIFAVRRKK